MSKSLFKFLFVVGLVVLVFILFVVVTIQGGEGGDSSLPVAQAHTGVSDRLMRFQTQDIVNGRFYSRNSNSSWVDRSSELSWVARNGDLVALDVGGDSSNNNNFKRVIVRSEQFVGRPWKVRFNGDATKVLIGFEPKRLFRSTILARYAIHDAVKGTLIAQLRVTPSSGSINDDYGGGGRPETFQAAVWASNDTLVATHKNDLFAVRMVEGGASGTGTATKVKRLTTDGSDFVVNGVADWVYEEEIFTQSATTIYPSLLGSHVAYLKFNDSTVEPYSYNLFGDYSHDSYDPYFQYPKYGTVRYPKSGSSNPIVSVHVFKLADPYCWEHRHSESCAWDLSLNDLMIKLLGNNNGVEYLIANVKWVSDSSFAMQVLNRVQNSSWLVGCDVGVRGCNVIRGWEQDNGWIDVGPLGVYKGELYSLMSVGGGLVGDGNEYNHVAKVGNDRVRYLTRGAWSVDEIVGVYGDLMVIKAPLLKTASSNSSSSNSVVMLADATQSHYYGVDLSSPSSMIRPPKCLTCYDPTCTYNTAKFTRDDKTGLFYMLNTCEKQRSVLHVDLLSISKMSNNSLETQHLMKLEENKNLDTLLSSYELPEVEYFSYEYKLGGKTFTLNCRVIGKKGWRSLPKVGVVVDVYGGPNSQKVTRRFAPNDWSYALTTSHPIVYLTIDGVGSGRQSNSLSFQVYRDLGNNEITDKVYALKRFLSENSNVDPKQTLIWGWSYGGYLSAMVMGKDVEQTYKCGISVAPVVNWHYYDTIYTERYMSTPEDNPVGYNRSSVLQHLDNFKNKAYLLVHGNADDNVHYQQSMVLARALEQKNVLFRMQSYPDENHSLGGVRQHVFATLEDFVLNQCFKI